MQKGKLTEPQAAQTPARLGPLRRLRPFPVAAELSVSQRED